MLFWSLNPLFARCLGSLPPDVGICVRCRHSFSLYAEALLHFGVMLTTQAVEMDLHIAKADSSIDPVDDFNSLFSERILASFQCLMQGKRTDDNLDRLKPSVSSCCGNVFVRCQIYLALSPTRGCEKRSLQQRYSYKYGTCDHQPQALLGRWKDPHTVLL